MNKKKDSFWAKIMRRKFSISIIIALLIAILFLFSENQNYKFSIFYNYQAIPHIDLQNTLYETQEGLSGKVQGFVKFDNIEDQPRSARQYYILKPLEYLDENQRQYFSLEEIIKMPSVSPTSVGTSLLEEASESTTTKTLEDKNGNQYFINKATKEVSMKDVGGDSTVLITSFWDYRDFMKEWLLERKP